MSSPTSQRPRVLTGDTPTGRLHLGHWVGSVERRVQLQHEYDCYFLLANMHAFTTRFDRTSDADYEKAGGLFPIPRALIGRVARLPGVGDGAQKMSKSLGNAIFLSDSTKDVQKKVNRITTGRQSPTEPGDPNNVLFKFVEAFIPDQGRVAELKDRYARGDNLGDGHVKQELAAAIDALLTPMRARRARFEQQDGDALILDIIKAGTRRANVVAEETLFLAKKAMNMDFGRRTLG